MGEGRHPIKFITSLGPRKVSHGKDAELCAKLLDTENFIFYDFQLQGYKSMW